MKIKPLPPLNSLVAFEASARHLSFTLAAEELNVTQGAISRQIRQLEEYLGKAMFTRANRSINLTPTGLQYYQSISQSLLDIAQVQLQTRETVLHAAFGATACWVSANNLICPGR